MSWWTEVPSSPYKGLAPFGYSDVDALLFFGRDREREILVAQDGKLTLYDPRGIKRRDTAIHARTAAHAFLR